MLRKCLLVFIILAPAALAHAQFGVYGTFTVDRLGNIQSSPLAVPSYTVNNTTFPITYRNAVNPTGGTLGAFYDFRNVGPVRLGVDARLNHITDKSGAQADALTSGTHIYSGLGGVRASFHTPIKAFVPYVQASAGYARSDFGLTAPSAGRTVYLNGTEYHVFGGMDIFLLPNIGWRAFEVGYGGITSGGHNYPIESVSTGIVFRFGAAH